MRKRINILKNGVYFNYYYLFVYFDNLSVLRDKFKCNVSYFI